MTDYTVKARYEADVSQYRRDMQSAAADTDKLAASADKAGAATRKAGDDAARAAEKAKQAQEKAQRAADNHADAAGRLRVAQERLDAARSSGKVAQIVAAEEGVARAQRDVESTARQAASAHDAYEAAAGRAADAAKDLNTRLEETSTRSGRVFDALRENSADLERAGGALAGFGAGLTAAAGGMGKVAMDWESAWAGVTKTNDGTAEQLAALQQGLRDMTGELPASHTEIAAVAEAAGQLGVGIEDVESFTRVMIDLGESTNLNAEEAASTLAKFSNIMGTNLSDADRLGSVIVGLGNNYATTESDIAEMSMRLAGVGKQMGMSEGDVMGLATAMSSVGIEAEAGGTAMSTVMKKIDQDVRAGGDSLDGWASAAGKSAQEFADAWQSDPAIAVDMLTTGLGEAGARGEDMNAILSDLGVKGIRESDTLIRLAGAAGLVGDAVESGNQAWDENSALVEEASKRYETAESRVRIAWNEIKDAAIDAGGAILPVVADLADQVATVVGAFTSLPDPVKGGVGALAAVGGVTLTAAGGFMMLAPRAVETVDAFRRLAPEGSKAAGALGKVGKAAGIASTVLVGLGVLKGIANDSVPAAHGVESVANAMLKVQESGDFSALDDLFDKNDDVRDFGDALRYLDPSDLDSHMESFGETVLGLRTSSAQAREQMQQLDQVLSSMTPEDAAAQFQRLREEAERSGSQQLSSWEGLKQILPEYAAQVEAASNATGKSADAATLYGIAMGHLPEYMRPAADAADQVAASTGDAEESLGALAQVDAESNVGGIAEAMAVLSDESLELEDRLSGVLDALFRMGILEQTAAEAAASFEAALDGVAAAVEENGATLDITTEAGRNNQAALNDIADAGRGLVTSLAEAGASQGELRDALERTYIEAYNAATAMGATSEEAEILARRAVGLNDMSVDIDTYLSDAALVAAEALGGAIEAIPGYRGVTVAVSDDGTTGTVQESIDEIDGVTRTVFVTTDGTEVEVQAKIESINGVDRTVWVDDQGTIYGTQQDIYAVTGKTVDVEAQATGLGTVESELAWAARTRYASVVVTTRYGDSTQKAAPGYSQALAAGGVARLPGYSAGGVLPRTGLGTDMILGVTSSGMPIARVDDGEMIVRRSSTDLYRGVLDRINRNDPSVHHLRGYAGGGRAGREWSAQSLAPQITVQAPAGGGVDSAAIGAAVHSALAGWRPVVELGDRAIYGMMRRAEQVARGR